jgi:hypothetical protein
MAGRPFPRPAATDMGGPGRTLGWSKAGARRVDFRPMEPRSLAIVLRACKDDARPGPDKARRGD